MRLTAYYDHLMLNHFIQPCTAASLTAHLALLDTSRPLNLTLKLMRLCRHDNYQCVGLAWMHDVRSAFSRADRFFSGVRRVKH
jgi:hypothetical protein